jgi:hypothetical protein
MAAFCERRVESKNHFDPRSFRWKKSGRVRILIGCPKGHWGQRERCSVGTRAYKILRPLDGRRCPVGDKRIVK